MSQEENARSGPLRTGEEGTPKVFPIKVVIGQDHRTISLLPNNSKMLTPVTLYFIGSSAESPLPEHDRRLPVDSITLPIDWKKRTSDLIILETNVGDTWKSHFVEIKWKNGTSGPSPVIDLTRPWLSQPDCPWMQRSLDKKGRVVLSVSIGAGEKARMYSTRRDTGGALFTSPDLLCRLAMGKIRPVTFQKKVAEHLGLMSDAFRGSTKEMVPSVRYEEQVRSLTEQLEALKAENAELKKSRAELESSIQAVKFEAQQHERASTASWESHLKLVADFSKLTEKNKELEQTLKSFQELHSSLSERFTMLLGKHGKTVSAQQPLEVTLTSLQEEHEKLKELRTTLQAEVETSKKSLALAETAGKDGQTLQSALTEKHVKLSAEHQKLQDKLQEVESCARHLGHTLNAIWSVVHRKGWFADRLTPIQKIVDAFLGDGVKHPNPPVPQSARYVIAKDS
ncbi:MAG: hypothetical protein Q7R64_02625 [bacterium]|nr:hypothetical protein [bacterium]